MENNVVSKNISSIQLKQNTFAEQVELIFNIGGIFCPVSTFIGLGIGAYNKKMAQENLDILVENLNMLITNYKLMESKITKLEKNNSKLTDTITFYKQKINELNNNMVDQKNVLTEIKQKTEDELRSFSFNLQEVVNATIKEKSKNKITKYANYIVDTILDELIFTPNDEFKYILSVINSLNQTDIEVLKDFDNSEEVYDRNFYYDKNYTINNDKRLSVQKLIKLGLVDYDADFYVPHRSEMFEGAHISVDKTYYSTKFFKSIKKYLFSE